jgi:hypothetical protein
MSTSTQSVNSKKSDLSYSKKAKAKKEIKCPNCKKEWPGFERKPSQKYPGERVRCPNCSVMSSFKEIGEHNDRVDLTTIL